VLAADGTPLACWDFAAPAGSAPRPAVLMVHGNGLNGLTWSPVARECQSRGLRCVALDLRAHGSSGRPGRRGPGGPGLAWERFGEDVLAAVDQLGLRPVVGAGHSAGATALLLAEAARPGTMAAIWAWEPIMAVPGVHRRETRGQELAERARHRRSRFASHAEARQHFSGRGIFAGLDDRALEGYLEGGLRAAPDGGWRLSCDPEDEATVYEGGGSHRAWEVLTALGCPVRLVGGELSPAVPPSELARIQARLAGSELAVVPGLGHLGPFQGPLWAATDIEHWAASARA
jgi:pimeloyl-ACP methyl ester carboxylesterase